jgi:hypothetical protein
VQEATLATGRVPSTCWTLLPLQKFKRGGAFGVGHEVQPPNLFSRMLFHVYSRGFKLLQLHATERAHTTTLPSGTLAASS